MRRKNRCGREERVGEGVRGRVGEGVIEQDLLPLSHSPTLPLCSFQEGRALSSTDPSNYALGITPN
jgi:hypothetical protein